MSALQPLEIWQVTGRDQTLADVMIKFKDRRGRNLCLGPTHEEMITEIAKKYVSSYKQLPFTLYQIQTKFRDELRPRHGLMRGCEFMMKDAYSFDADQDGLDKSYDIMFNAYNDIFSECGLDFISTSADSGAMGGSVSHEFMVCAEIGEDVMFRCLECNNYLRQQGICSSCGAKLEECRMIEVGHVFKLGTKYSSLQGAVFLDAKGVQQTLIMGCYGIGVSRLVSAIIETNCDDSGIIWPKSVAPYAATVVVLDDSLIPQATALALELKTYGLDVLIDDRKESAGRKFNDALLIGNPYTLVFGKSFKNSEKIELEDRRTKEKMSLSQEELLNFLKKSYNV